MSDTGNDTMIGAKVGMKGQSTAYVPAPAIIPARAPFFVARRHQTPRIIGTASPEPMNPIASENSSTSSGGGSSAAIVIARRPATTTATVPSLTTVSSDASGLITSL